MTFQTHLAAGLAGTVALMPYTQNPGVLIVGGVIGSVLPDIDEPKSLVGKALLPVSELICKYTRHREATHSIFMLLASVLFCVFSLDFGIGLTVGVLTHILLDMCSNTGVAILAPSSRKRYTVLPSRYRIATASDEESYWLIGLMLCLSLSFFRYSL